MWVKALISMKFQSKFENDSAINIVHRLFSIYFSTGFIPVDWNYSIISLISESSTGDIRNPDFAPACHNIYCDVLNMRFEIWVTENSISHAKPNGFRKSWSALDHLLTVTSIIETLKPMEKDMFVSFIEFSKAMDSIPQFILWSKKRNGHLVFVCIMP